MLIRPVTLHEITVFGHGASLSNNRLGYCGLCPRASLFLARSKLTNNSPLSHAALGKWLFRAVAVLKPSWPRACSSRWG
jgi:hypothetical protein